MTPLSIKQSLYYGSPIVSQLHFPLSKLHCHKLQEKIIIIKLVIIHYTVTQHKPSIRMDTYIDFNDSFTFLDSYIYFFHIIGKISLFCQSHPCQILPISSCYFPLNNLCKIIAIRSQADTTKILERGYREFRISIFINDWSNRFRQIQQTKTKASRF